MPARLNDPRGILPRLDPVFYRGTAVVFWTHAVKDRATGWLPPEFHAAFREITLHAAVREQLLCPVYTLMPDHIHLVWMGVSPNSDQRLAATLLRSQLETLLRPHCFQHQPHDHVLREGERQQPAFKATCNYICENPVRAALVATARDWTFTGCIAPGYFQLNPFASDYWEKFWKIYCAAIKRGIVGKNPLS